MADDRPQQTSAQREYQEYAATDGGEHPATDQEPDVLLDVPVLKVGAINLEVRGLRAHVAVLAELANLVNLSVGADVRLDLVNLEITGVRAQALLKVRLENVRAILEKALDTIAENPQILEGLAQTVDRTAEQVGGAAREAVGEGGAMSQAAGRITEGAQGAVGQVAGQAGQAAQGVPEEAQGEVKAHALRRAPGPRAGGGPRPGWRHGCPRLHHPQGCTGRRLETRVRFTRGG